MVVRLVQLVRLVYRAQYQAPLRLLRLQDRHPRLQHPRLQDRELGGLIQGCVVRTSIRSSVPMGSGCVPVRHVSALVVVPLVMVGVLGIHIRARGP